MRILSIATVAVAFAMSVACGGSTDAVEEDFEIDEASSPIVSAAVDGADDDHECKDGDRDGHRKHRKHHWKVLDRLDGTKDHAITIAALPAGLPARLLEKLHALDANADGAVTRDELKAARHDKHEKKHAKKAKKDHDDDQDDQGENED